MPYKKEILSPAKVNLILRIGPRRRDSYHDIASLFMRANWGDDLKLEIEQNSSTQVDLNCSEDLISNDQNIVVKAAKLFSEAIPVFFHLKVDLKKRIPMEAGLGGGSSNAAQVLSFLAGWYEARIGKYPRMKQVINSLAQKLGSDISFFLSDLPAAWCMGRGEKIQGVKTRSYWALLVFPTTRISTAWAYKELDKKRRSVKLDTKIPSWLGMKDLEVPILENDFESLALESQEELSRLKADLRCSGALCGQMSGSGSAFFGIFDSERSLEAGEAYMQSKSWNCQKVSIGE